MPTCFESYETYQRGPAAVLRLFEEALGTRAIYGPPDPDTRQRAINSLSDEIDRLKRQVSRLKAALGEARGEVVTHRPARRRHCSESLAGARGTSVERRQVVELAPARLRVTGHRAEVVRCSSCGRRTKAGFVK